MPKREEWDRYLPVVDPCVARRVVCIIEGHPGPWTPGTEEALLPSRRPGEKLSRPSGGFHRAVTPTLRPRVAVDRAMKVRKQA